MASFASVATIKGFLLLELLVGKTVTMQTRTDLITGRGPVAVAIPVELTRRIAAVVIFMAPRQDLTASKVSLSHLTLSDARFSWRRFGQNLH